MPELPEVETIRLGLQRYLVGVKPRGGHATIRGKTIGNIEIRIPKIFIGDKKNVIGAKIVGLKRIGKGLIIELDNDYVLAVHLKMTGQLIYSDSKTKNLTLSPKIGGTALPSKYSHVIFSLDNGGFLYYNDLRQFGWIKVVRKNDLMQMPFFKEMGPEPLVASSSGQAHLTLELFKKIVLSSNVAIKVLLMDQKKIGGVGNIYANDSLFDSGIMPSRKAKNLADNEIKRLYDSLLKVLKKSLEHGGSSDENFVNALGQEGNYQKHALVYGKEDEPCKICKTPIEKIKLGGRGTYFCENCQK